MPILVPNGLNKGIAFFQKGKKTIFQRSLLIWKQNRQKKRTQSYTIASSVLWDLEAFEQWIGIVAGIVAGQIPYHGST